MQIGCPFTPAIQAHFILFVSDQNKSTEFYRKVLNLEPRLHVPGMTEFYLGAGAILGLMPALGIKRLLQEAIAEPSALSMTPRAELYLQVQRPEEYLSRAAVYGGRHLSPVLPRDWGASVGYVADLDEYIIAFAAV